MSVARAQVAVEPYLGACWFDDDPLDFAFQEVEFDAGAILGAYFRGARGLHILAE